MNKQIKSGKEIVDDFFNNMENLSGVDLELARSLTTLYKDNKFTERNIQNELRKLRDHEHKN